MGPMGPMRPMRLIGLMGLLGLLGGCSGQEEGDEMAVTETTVEVMSCMTSYDEHVMATRAWIPPTTFLPYDVADKAIGICLTQNGQDPKKGYLFKSSGKWRTDIELDAPANYYLYGYAPHTPGMTCAISSSSTPGDNSAYGNGAVMTLDNVPSVTPSDVCVVIGATNGKDDYKANADYSVASLTRGNFYYQAKANRGDEAGGNYIYLLFDHLYAALSFSIRVHSDYAALRTIKLKELQVETSAGDEPTTEKTCITITLNKTLDGSDPIESIVFTPKGAAMSAATVFASSAGELLSMTPSVYQCQFMPRGITKIKLTSTYDVYDKNPSDGHPEGNLLRKDCKATNTFSLSLFDQQTEFLRGRRYTINLTIQPTYLYVLSEPDLNSPTVTVE